MSPAQSVLNTFGQRFGRLTVIDQAPRVKSQTRLNCLCDCGSRYVVSKGNLVSGSIKSCGCSKKELLRPPRIDGSNCLIFLPRDQVAVVDLCDSDLGALNWSVERSRNTWYAYRWRRGDDGRRHHRWLHREIAARAGMQIDGLEVDHRDGNGLNNRRSNLRAATHAQNMQNMRTPSSNTSGVRGVYWDKREARWIASVRYNGKALRLGGFDSIELASAAFQEAAQRIYGEFARTT